MLRALIKKKQSLRWSRDNILLWNANVRYLFHKSLPLVAIPNRMSPTQLHTISVTSTWMVYSDYGQVPLAASSLQIIPSNFLSIFRLPDICHIFCPLSMISSTAGCAHTGRAKLFGTTRNRIPASVNHTKIENQGKIKPTPTEMSSDEDTVVRVPWGWLLSVDVRS
jgi:hypothetical protein